MFNPSREQAREFFYNTWEKYQAHEALSDLEKLVLQIILLHPEYQAVLKDRDRFLNQDYAPEMGDVNPFLHMSMHLALAEQLAIDQPPGIRARYEQLIKKTGSEHDAVHICMECLGEMVWHAQRYNTSPDATIYFSCLDKQLR